MRITFITTQMARWGGSEELWVRSAELAISQGHTVQAVVYGQPDGLHPLLLKLKAGAVSFVQLKNDFLPRGVAAKVYNRMAEAVLPHSLQAVDSFNPDCMFISQGNNYSAAFHPAFFSYLSKTARQYFLISQFNVEHFCLPYTDLLKARLLMARARCVFFVSQRNLDVTRRQLAMEIKNARVIDNPLNLNAAAYQTYPLAETIQFASVARLSANYKGQDILLQVFAEPQWQRRNWHLNFYGIGEDEQYLKELTAFYQLSNKVTFHGQAADVAVIWQHNHALLMPSLAEGKPLALQEAMVCGRIGIVSDVGGNAELINDGRNGYIASSYFPQPFAEAMERAWVDKGFWGSMGEAAHSKMMAHLDLQPHVTLLNVLNELSVPNKK